MYVKMHRPTQYTVIKTFITQILSQNAEEQLSAMEALKREVSILRSTEEQIKTLRTEREQLDAELRTSNNRITELQESVAPMQAKNRELTAQNTALQVKNL